MGTMKVEKINEPSLTQAWSIKNEMVQTRPEVTQQGQRQSFHYTTLEATVLA